MPGQDNPAPGPGEHARNVAAHEPERIRARLIAAAAAAQIRGNNAVPDRELAARSGPGTSPLAQRLRQHHRRSRLPAGRTLSDEPPDQQALRAAVICCRPVRLRGEAAETELGDLATSRGSRGGLPGSLVRWVRALAARIYWSGRTHARERARTLAAGGP